MNQTETLRSPATTSGIGNRRRVRQSRRVAGCARGNRRSPRIRRMRGDRLQSPVVRHRRWRRSRIASRIGLPHGTGFERKPREEFDSERIWRASTTLCGSACGSRRVTAPGIGDFLHDDDVRLRRLDEFPEVLVIAVRRRARSIQNAAGRVRCRAALTGRYQGTTNQALGRSRLHRARHGPASAAREMPPSAAPTPRAAPGGRKSSIRRRRSSKTVSTETTAVTSSAARETRTTYDFVAAPDRHLFVDTIQLARRRSRTEFPPRRPARPGARLARRLHLRNRIDNVQAVLTSPNTA